mmetsp:Transcript_26530/g.41547  ORF Transcript_26530/g.41547 Transcript_26530/m.41547 type:complete len:90 (+) Transcript_26530:225-494(+)
MDSTASIGSGHSKDPTLLAIQAANMAPWDDLRSSVGVDLRASTSDLKGPEGMRVTGSELLRVSTSSLPSTGGGSPLNLRRSQGSSQVIC